VEEYDYIYDYDYVDEDESANQNDDSSDGSEVVAENDEQENVGGDPSTWAP